MYNVFQRMEVLHGIDVVRMRVYKAANKNTLRRIKGEGWKKCYDLASPQRALAIVVKKKIAARYIPTIKQEMKVLKKKLADFQALLDDYAKE